MGKPDSGSSGGRGSSEAELELAGPGPGDEVVTRSVVQWVRAAVQRKKAERKAAQETWRRAQLAIANREKREQEAFAWAIGQWALEAEARLARRQFVPW